MKPQSVSGDLPVRRIHQDRNHLKMRFAMRFRRCVRLAVVNGIHALVRLIDILLSITVLILAAPLMTLIALLIRRDGGPVFSTQRRIDFDGRGFGMLRFRSVGADASAACGQPLAQDEGRPAVTAIGRFIRQSNIDELPQLFNVMCGDISLIGRRRCLPPAAKLYTSADHRRVHVMPGGTCLWEVVKHSNLESHSFLRDAGMLFKTIPAIVRG